MGVITPEGQGRGASYHLSPELHATRGWLEARLPALRTFFTAHEVLKNADHRQLFSISSRSAASRELSRLVKQGYRRPRTPHVPRRAFAAQEKRACS